MAVSQDDFCFTVTHTDSNSAARTGVIHTGHGDIETPCFVPVGTQASVKSLSPDDLNELGIRLFFVNTYHMYLRPGLAVIRQFGGLHRFMGWNGPVITDSGGFQVFSLGKKRMLRDGRGEAEAALVSVDDNGVTFRSHWDGSEHQFTPERSMEFQWALGSDIHVAFDECTEYPATYARAKESLARTHRWADRSLSSHGVCRKNSQSPYQALYGVIQGSTYEDLRTSSARYITSLPFDGVAIGGVSVGESKQEMTDVLSWISPLLPAEKPRHLLGVGEFDDIIALIAHGVDTFDCVQPTRLARMGQVFSRKERKDKGTEVFHLDLSKSRYAAVAAPIDPSCSCYTCSRFSLAYLYHLFHVRELLAYRLASIHNIAFVQRFVRDIRKHIKDGTFLELRESLRYNKS